ncbi:adenine nucleotide alpha hydrolase [Chryseolinea lacunae]|uniref:Adenine nucleotide alpha hydrolase n=1 Tax=Chryseolinea lacunae TaxID=2801331 RepID=A0ABS1KSF3_9BACT|nr:adenine nucleotide alpha hydrolase [Chryseolinea lacunae]MBL0742359.1 adenine nucleotide alpha hydrolase [Chryseolinea lacunae]
MDSKRKVTISWSGGKDSAFALYKILLSGDYHVVNLHTVFGDDTKRVGLHGVREALIERQAECLGLPLVKLHLRESDNHQVYAALMQAYYKKCAQQGITHIVFGDIFLEDLRDYREQLLAGTSLQSVYPLWKIDSNLLVNDFVGLGFKTAICSADADVFSETQVGQTIDAAFIENLPNGVDPCGENGEFHSMVYDGPVFKTPLLFDRGEVVKKAYTFQKKNEQDEIEVVSKAFWFQDLLPRIA